MQKRIFAIVGLLVAGFMFYSYQQEYANKTEKPVINGENRQEPEAESPKEFTKSSSIFVPYWADLSSESDEEYDRYIYFGVTANERGIDTQDIGYKNIDSFVEFAGSTEKWLTLRMVDTEMSSQILQNPSFWDKIAADTVQVAQENDFDGVVLDLEVGLVSFHISPNQITDFTAILHRRLEKAGIPLAFAVYGDTAYRKRPYDVKAINENSEEIMIMAYDFHKSFGLAGPNFPLNGVDEYGYDFKTMINDFTEVVPEDKLSVIFGMYGYEWVVDEQDRPEKAANALSLSKIESVTNPCTKPNCEVKTDPVSAETKVTFSGEGGKRHVIWFENEESVAEKQKFLYEKGIGSSVYWVYGYF